MKNYWPPRPRVTSLLLIALVMGLTGCAANDPASRLEAERELDAAMAFGGPGDVRFAQALWEALLRLNIVGADAIETHLYRGLEPHGEVLQTVDLMANINGEFGPLIVTSNYSGAGAGITGGAVLRNPAARLQNITVMHKRTGYDAEARDWYWASYLPDGTLVSDSGGVAQAGKLARGAREGDCIGCHAAAPGGDYVFSHDRYR